MRSSRRAIAAAIAALFVPVFAEAACTIGDMAGKNWRVSGTEITDGILFFCKVPVSATTSTTSASIPAVPGGCQDHYTGSINASFTNPAPVTYSINSGNITLANATQCIFSATLLVDGSYTIRARMNLDAGKTVATGNFLVSWGGGGAFSMVRY